jgi:hypothetical protein
MDKLQWINSLKPGDLVCDCRYKHLKIKTIDLDYGPDMRNPINKLMVFLMSYKYFDWFTMPWDNIMRIRYIPLFNRIYDAHIELEDGSCCSAFHCCDRPDHEEKHPE